MSDQDTEGGVQRPEREMDTGQAIKQQIHQAIDTLPPESLGEVSHFLDSLKFKYQAGRSPEVVALGGLWKDLSFDVSDADVRALRQKVSQTLLRKT